MRIECRVRGLDGAQALRGHCEDSLRLALGRVQTEVERVSLTLDDACPEGVRCRVRARLCEGGEPVLGEVHDGDPQAAIDGAADQVRRAVRRRLGLRRAPRGG